MSPFDPGGYEWLLEWDKDHAEKCVFILVSRNEILVVQMIVADIIILVVATKGR